MARAKMRHLHSSSRFDRSAVSLFLFLKAFLGIANVITLTEVGNDARVKLLRRLPGWQFVQVENPKKPGADECALLYKRRVWAMLSVEVVKLTDLHTSDRGKRLTYALSVALQHRRTLQRALVSVAHTPAHIEFGDKLRRNVDSAAWLDAVNRWGGYLAGKRKDGFQIVCVADWNVNLARQAHADRLRKHVGFKSSWRRALHRGVKLTGTHGSRTIDDTRSSLALAKIRKVNPMGSSDHDAYYEVLLFPALGAKPAKPAKETPGKPAGTITGRVVDNARRRGLTVLERDQWGTKREALYQLRRRIKPVRQGVDTLVAHITVTTGASDFRQGMRDLEGIGFVRFGSGLSYNLVIDMRTGVVGVGQPLDAKGTHTVNDKGIPGWSHDQNLVARAIAFRGMPGDVMSAEARHSFVQLTAALMDEGAITHDPDVLPHSFFAAKDCPTNTVRNQLPAMKADAKREAA